MKKPQKLSRLILVIILKNVLIVWIFSILVSSIFRLIEGILPHDYFAPENVVFFVGIIIATAHAIAIAILLRNSINKIVTSRIRTLNDATNEVIDGNLEIKLDVIGTDELSNLADSFNKMTKGLQSNEYLNREFARNTSHEFKTPLSTVRAYGELIEAETKKDDVNLNTINEYAGIIISESERLTNLTKSILQISLIDSAMHIKKDDEFSLDEQIKQILRLRYPKWSTKKIIFDLNLDELNIVSNQGLLYQVWQNLIDNAIKFSDESGIISIRLKKDVDEYYFEITNSGTGIAKEDKDKIFSQFFMSDKSRNSEGSGLGLSIVKKILSKLDGDISFESNENESTTFVVRIKEKQ